MNSEFSTTEDHTENPSNLQSQDGFAFVESSKRIAEVEFVDARVKSEPFYDFNDESDNLDAGKHNTQIKHERKIKIEEIIVKNELNDSTYDDSCGLIDTTNSSTSEIPIEEEKSALENIGVKLSRKFYTCSVCDYKTTSSYDLRMHIPKHQRTQEVRPYKCSNCQYAGLTAGKLEEHMKTHLQKIQLSCTLCEYVTTNATSLKFHKKTHATGARLHKLIISGFVPTKPYNLRVHMRTHKGAKYKYNKYEYTGLTKGMVNEHMKPRTQLEHHRCTLCPYATTNSVILESHMKIHTGETRIDEVNSAVEIVNVDSSQNCHTCNVCEYTTTISNKLKMHMSIHAGEKLYNCTICQCASLSRVKLNEHMKSHTGILLYDGKSELTKRILPRKT